MTTADINPLELVEKRVLERARDAAVEVDEESTDELRPLIVEEVTQWSLDFKNGHRPFDLVAPELVVDRAWRNLTGYGPLQPLLDDDDVWEIMINAPDQVFVKRHRGTSGYHDESFHDDDHVLRTLTKILDDASTSQRKLDPSEGLQDAQLDGGARLHIVHRDVGRGNHMLVNIRKFTGVGFHSLDQLVDQGMLTHEVSHFLGACMRSRASIVFAGPPGSGKTTMLSCCTAELDPSLRVITAEEVFEVDVPQPNVASMQTRAARPDRPEVDLRRLVAGFLRMAPDIAIVGEVRDREALPLLLTLSSGVKGYTTIHAGSARQALTRLRFIAQLADTRSELPMTALNALVTEAVDVVVHTHRVDGIPRVTEIVAVEHQQTGADAATFTTTQVHRRGADGRLAWTGQLPQRLVDLFARDGVDLRELLDDGGARIDPGRASTRTAEVARG